VIVGVDVGGTFTDVVGYDGSAVTTAKLPTTEDQSDAVVAGAAEVTDHADRFLHGTTVATNAILERTGAAVGLVTDPGFEDVIEIGRQDRPALYDSFADRPDPLVPRDLRSIVAESAALAAVGSVAVALLRSYEDPSAEHAIRAAIAAVAPSLPVSLSSEVAPEFREFERTSTTVLNAYLVPVVAAYLRTLSDRVRTTGFAEDVFVMRSSGGLMGAGDAAELPAAILLSGPAGGALAAGALGSAMGIERVIAFDMGGTSTDVCRIERGRPEVAYQRAIDGYVCRMPSAAIHTVGAGGGSIGWVDSGGSLRVGPQSAGAVPGPACYQRGGTAATVTDANVALGRIAPGAILGGRLALDSASATAALGRLGDALGLDAIRTALGVTTIVEEVMGAAIRTVSIEQGADPRDAWLVAFGGAGGLHATALARGLDMAGVVIPPHCGVFSALGLLLSPPRADRARSAVLTAADLPRLDTLIGEVAGEARRDLPASTVTTLCDVRYLGQSHELSVAYAAGDGWSELERRFHEVHRERNGFARSGDPLEVVTVRAEAVGTPPIGYSALPGWRPHGEGAVRSRSVKTGGGDVSAAIYRREGLAVGAEIAGPAVVEEAEATTWVGAGERATVSDSGALEITW